MLQTLQNKTWVFATGYVVEKTKHAIFGEQRCCLMTLYCCRRVSKDLVFFTELKKKINKAY